jgi:hypothetical protein
MRIITERSRILNVVTLWREQYKESCDHWHYEVLERLIKLDLKTVKAEEVDSIIGNDSWTICQCYKCKGRFDQVIEVGEETGSDPTTVQLCKDCLIKALYMIS